MNPSPNTLNYARPIPRHRHRRVAFFAHLTAIYPLAVLIMIYMGRLLTWYAIAHPQKAIDQCMTLLRSSSKLAFSGLVPGALAALVFNAIYISDHQSNRIFWRPFLVWFIWIGAYYLICIDPGGIIKSWYD